MNNYLLKLKDTSKMKQLIMAFLLFNFSAIALSGQCNLACNDQTDVLVDGTVEVTPDMILEGDYSSCANFDPIVTIADFNGITTPNSPFLTAADAGKFYTVTVFDQGNDNLCWGTLQVYGTGPIGLALGNKAVPIGAETCIPVQVTNFTQVTGGQFSLTWDATVLKYESFISPLQSAAEINITDINDGNLTAYLSMPALQLITRPNGSTLMEFCFEGLTEASDSEVCLSDNPTEIAFQQLDNQGNAVQAEITTSCGALTVAECEIPCLPKLAISVAEGDERMLTADYFLLESQCSFPDATLTLSDASGNSVSSITTAQAGTIIATISDAASGQSCSTELTVSSCDDPPVNLFISQRLVGDKVYADFKVSNAGLLLGYQFEVNYDPAVLKFSEFELAADQEFMSDLNSSSNDSGKINIVRLVINTEGPIAIPNGATLFSAAFDVLKEENTTIYLGGDHLETMFVDENVEERCVNAPAQNFVITGAGVTGSIYDDINKDCLADGADLSPENWLIELTEQSTGDQYYGNSRADGTYLVYALAGTYTVTAYSPNDLWTFCENEITATLPNDNDKVTVDFLAQADKLCSELTVDVGANFLRRCFENTYHVSYCNDGTTEAKDAYIEVDLDPYMSFVVSNNPTATVSGQTVTFQVGDVPYGACGEFWFKILLDCNGTSIGQTHCVEARIYPDEECFAPDPSWSGASLEINGECVGEEVIFTIQNVGVGDMTEALEFIVIEDDVMKPGSPIQLGATEAHALDPFPADGTTYRVTIPQVANHPSLNIPTLAVEGCGENGTGTFSTGFVNMFPLGDGDSNIDIDCIENRGSFDPNDKAVTPEGYTDKNYISANTDLDYRIRFQNTGTDTAFKVVVVDQISENLDLRTLKLGASSHAYELEIQEDRQLVFTFDNIMLVDSITNEPGSHGFIKYSISQMLNLEDGNEILNDANIYFDFNEPVLTNLTRLEIGSETPSYTNNLEDIGLSIYPNPTTDFIDVRHEYDGGSATLFVYDQLGRVVIVEPLKNQTRLSVETLPVGSYEYRVTDMKKLLATGKFSKM